MAKPPPRAGGMIQIYKISFPDGSAYVGQTRQPIFSRLAQHRRSNPCNSILHRNLLIMKPTVEALSRHRKQEIADREERKWIMGLEKPINRYIDGKQINVNPEAPSLRDNRWPKERNRRKRPKYPRRDSGYHVCSWCWRKLPVSEFYSDCCRSVGLSSRCKRCAEAESRARREAIRKREDTSVAYFQTKLACQALRTTKTRPVVKVV
ncbi:MAG: hypothetical protein OXG75_06395 [Candidatus Dadabacteria bacterium]|nr:hypothetical protein [Candidatus Dadabacteria bacterium]